MKSTISTLWLFATVNYLYCDVVSLMDPNLLRQYLTGSVHGMSVTQGFLLAAGVLVEIPMAMILLSRILGPSANRWANLAAGALMTVVQLSTLFAGKPAPYYVFFSVIEVATTAAIFLVAWKLGAATRRRPSLSPRNQAFRAPKTPDSPDYPTIESLLGAFQAADHLHDRQAQSAWAERAGDDRQDRPQQLHVGPNGT